jgi:hypothetical protein
VQGIVEIRRGKARRDERLSSGLIKTRPRQDKTGFSAVLLVSLDLVLSWLVEIPEPNLQRGDISPVTRRRSHTIFLASPLHLPYSSKVAL